MRFSQDRTFAGFPMLILLLTAVSDCRAAQLSPRIPGQPEATVSEEHVAKSMEFIEDYNANFALVDRFAVAIYVEQNTEKVGEGVSRDQSWFLHSEDRDKPIRRMDQITRRVGESGADGLPYWALRSFTSFASPKSVSQICKNGQSLTAVGFDRENLANNPADSKQFAYQDELNAINVSFAGFNSLIIQGNSPSVVWKAHPAYPRILTEKFSVVGFFEDGKTTSVRFLVNEGPQASSYALDVVFSKEHGNMPVKTTVSHNGSKPNSQGVQWKLASKWASFDKDGVRIVRKLAGQKAIWLPVEITSEGMSMPLNKPHTKYTFEANLHWILGKKVPLSVFESGEQNFVSSFSLKDAILSVESDLNP